MFAIIVENDNDDRLNAKAGSETQRYTTGRSRTKACFYGTGLVESQNQKSESDSAFFYRLKVTFGAALPAT
ncbi:predicted protein [Sclerotinia sclerotiorum 1980 UF-70]|uniref:Uncharacterized protein n=1 Tax=Sclerotinia sclerotiorum (strain ATCC 18683 / 1980 / Ss-1) TaxID=665079 RepID=A7EJM0_SCLS1|nr:predicted protein [Sclerotinia sclerotiorum 1980 UF-70]EDO03036.1 predicted protein [Sclerotinia sclerotiorum 1980 UF-70]